MNDIITEGEIKQLLDMSGNPTPKSNLQSTAEVYKNYKPEPQLTPQQKADVITATKAIDEQLKGKPASPPQPSPVYGNSSASSQSKADLESARQAAEEKQKKAAEEKIKAEHERTIAEQKKAEYNRSPEGIAKRNVNNLIDQQKSFLEKMDGVESMGRDELRKAAADNGDFAKQYKSVIDEAGKFSLKERFGQKVGYVKAAIKDTVFNLFGGGTAERMNDTHHYRNEYKAGIQEKIEQRVDSKIREDILSTRKSVGESLGRSEKILDQINKHNPLAIAAGQTNEGIYKYGEAMKGQAKREAAAQATKGAGEAAGKAASKGWGWKGKAGAVAGLLALGGVIGNQFAGGHKSNAELYNPNPQPQYYS